MGDLVIRVRENGPYVIELPIQIVDHLGNVIPIPAGKPVVALCRCGCSGNKPFCDGSHKRVGFQATAPTAPNSAGPAGPA